MNKIWVFRLSLKSGGEPQSDMCLIDTDRGYIEDKVKDLKKDLKSPEDVETKEVTIELLIKEFTDKGKLRQGWGMSDNKANVDLNLELDYWIANFIYLYSELWEDRVDCSKACGRYNILKLMKDMERGDIIFVPKIPNDDCFMVATVKKGYSFEPIIDTLEDGRPFGRHGHVIDVDKNTIRKFKYTDTFRPKVFNPYQKAVCEVKDAHQNYQFLNDFIGTYYR
ncbi:MAG: hypothetical protein K8S18_17240 [Desulfobacula sp.]|nr:hypothetical protein [Desulfobacula sp.]